MAAAMDVQQLLGNLSKIDEKALGGNELARMKLLSVARGLCQRLEKPHEFIERVCYQNGPTLAATKMAIDLKLFSKMQEDDGCPKTAEQIAQATGAEPAFMKRFLRHLGATGLLREIAPDTYGPSKLSDAFCTAGVYGGFNFYWHRMQHSWIKAPAYYAETGYKVPADEYHCAFQQIWNTPLSNYEWQKENPQIQGYFDAYMAMRVAGKFSWADFYPTETLITGAEKEDELVLVDVGGGYGHDLMRLLAKHPKAKGRYILQDQEQVVASANVSDKVEVMAADLFDPQPVKGARAYFLGAVMHNWRDEQARKILENIKSAMTPGYSRILIKDGIIPAMGAPVAQTVLDLSMMSFLSAVERTEEMWKELLASAGLKLVAVHRKVPMSVLEVEIA